MPAFFIYVRKVNFSKVFQKPLDFSKKNYIIIMIF